MNLQSILQKYYHLKDNGGWTAVETADGRSLEGFRTKRLAKCYPDGRFYFTIGETKKGKRNRLSESIRKIISEENLAVIEEPSTSGQHRMEKNYVGFSLNSCQEAQTLEYVIQKIEQAIAQCV